MERKVQSVECKSVKCGLWIAECWVSLLDAALTVRFAKKTGNTTHLKRCACHENCNASSEKVAKVLCVPHKTTFVTSCNILKCQEVPSLPRKTTLQPVLKPSTRKGFAASPIDTAMAPQKPATRDETCWTIKTSISRKTS